MAKKKEVINLIDPLDADAAISDIQSILRHKGMSTYDLAVELGWSRAKVEEFLHGVDIPNRVEFEEVARVLDYELEF